MSERLFSQFIRHARTTRGLKQEQLGAACSPPRSQEAVAQWESGAHLLSESTLEAVATALGMTLRGLLLEGLGVVKPPSGVVAKHGPSTSDKKNRT